MDIIVKKGYDHYNRALGKHIRNKRQYNDELKRRGMVSFEEGCRLAESKRKESKWIPSKDCIDMLRDIKHVSGNKDTIVLGQYPKIVEKLKEKGMQFDKEVHDAVQISEAKSLDAHT